MKIHFACSTAKFTKYQNNYLTICKEIKELGNTITRDWIEEGIEFFEKKKTDIDRTDIYKKTIESILASDMLIVEGTVSSFSVGHQITVAINKNKPVLFLTYEKKDEKTYFGSSFIDGIKTPLITNRSYNFSNLKNILEDFINKNKGGATIKFNIVLTKEIDNYLDWASFSYKKNKSEYIREIIEKHIEEKDKKYQKYLKFGIS